MDKLTHVQSYRLLSSRNNENLKMTFFFKDPVFPSLPKFESQRVFQGSFKIMSRGQFQKVIWLKIIK